MQIHKFTYPSSVLAALPKDQLSAFLLLGHFLNEANWLQKLLLYATQDTTGSEAERNARLALSLMAAKLFAATIHEGWLKLTSGRLANTLKDVPQSAKAQRIYLKLKKHLAKDSMIHRIRNNHAFHYPTALSLDGLPGIAQSDLALYMTPHAGDTLSSISALSAAAEMNDVGGSPRVGKSLDRIMKEVVRVSGLYTDYLHAMLAALLSSTLTAPPLDERIENHDAQALEDVRLRFFVTPPGVPGEV